MSSASFLAAVVALLVTAASVSAQTGRARAAADLFDAVPHAAELDPTFATELTIHWTVAEAPSDEPVAASDLRPVNRFEVLSQRPSVAGFVRERAPELSPDWLVVIAVDANGRELSWQKVRDPRIVRAEIPDSSLELSGQVFYRPTTELLVTVPDVRSVAALHVFAVERDADTLFLQELGQIPVAAR